MDALVGEKMASKKTHKDTLNSDHRQRAMVDRYMTCSGLLKEIYEDKDGQRREEVAKLSGPNEFAEFYERLKQIKEFHRRHPGEAISVPMSVEFDELKKAREGNDDTIMAEFTDEEGYGRFLDLHECYEKYVNLKGEFGTLTREFYEVHSIKEKFKYLCFEFWLDKSYTPIHQNKTKVSSWYGLTPIHTSKVLEFTIFRYYS